MGRFKGRKTKVGNKYLQETQNQIWTLKESLSKKNQKAATVIAVILNGHLHEGKEN